MSDPRWSHSQYLIRRKVLKLVGGAFHVFDPTGAVVFYSRMKAWTLREDIRLFTREDMQEEILRISARQIIDFSAAYDIVDATTGAKLGALKRKGFKSILRDHWILMDANDTEVGSIIEDHVALAIMRRLLGEIGSLISPQRYHIDIGGITVATGRQNRNPFVYKVTLDFSPDVGVRLDKRVGLAAGLLLAAIEGKQG